MCKLNKFTATLYVNENTKEKGAEGIVWEHDSEMKVWFNRGTEGDFP